MVFPGAVSRAWKGVRINVSTSGVGVNTHIHPVLILRDCKHPQPFVFPWSLKKYGDQRFQAL